MGNTPDGSTALTDLIDPVSTEDTDDEAVESDGRTPEEVEAFWRNRVSKKDRAHAAAERALREQIASLQSQVEARATGSSADGREQSNTEVAELRRQLEMERQARVVDQRKGKYPALAQQVGGSDAIFLNADEATLARLNALADDESDQRGGTPLIAPTNPKRPAPTAQKSIEQMGKEELLANLKRLSDQMVEERA